MSRMISLCRYTLVPGLLLLCLCSTAFAQDDFSNSSGQQETAKNEGHAEKTYVIRLEAVPPKRKYCHVNVEIGYLQKNTSAVVDVAIDNPDCAASSGSYAVVIRFRDENSDSQTVEYEETWERENDLSLETRREYYLGENVDLASVRIKRPKCVCAEIPTEGNDTLVPTTN